MTQETLPVYYETGSGSSTEKIYGQEYQLIHKSPWSQINHKRIFKSLHTGDTATFRGVSAQI